MRSNVTELVFELVNCEIIVLVGGAIPPPVPFATGPIRSRISARVRRPVFTNSNTNFPNHQLESGPHGTLVCADLFLLAILLYNNYAILNIIRAPSGVRKRFTRR